MAPSRCQALPPERGSAGRGPGTKGCTAPGGCCVARVDVTAGTPGKSLSASLTAPASHLRPFNSRSEEEARGGLEAQPYTAGGCHPGPQSVQLLCPIAGSLHPSFCLRPPALATVSSRRRDVPRSGSPHTCKGLPHTTPAFLPTERQVPLQPSSHPHPRGQAPATELPVLETPVLNCTCPSLWAPGDIPVPGRMVARKTYACPKAQNL